MYQINVMMHYFEGNKFKILYMYPGIRVWIRCIHMEFWKYSERWWQLPEWLWPCSLWSCCCSVGHLCALSVSFVVVNRESISSVVYIFLVIWVVLEIDLMLRLFVVKHSIIWYLYVFSFCHFFCVVYSSSLIFFFCVYLV